MRHKNSTLFNATAESLGIYTQTVLQCGAVTSRARGDRAPLLETLVNLKNYFMTMKKVDVAAIEAALHADA
jgi:hypothetical protein